MIRTIEEILGAKPFNLNDSVAVPMAEVFDTTIEKWSFTAKPSALLATTQLPIDPSLFSGLRPMTPTHNAQYWAAETKGMNFSVEDDFDFNQFNRILWQGLMGNKPYPAGPNKKDLRNNRVQLLDRYFQSQRTQQTQTGGEF